MKILISGGHLTPALSLIDFVLEHKNDQLIFVGRKYSQTALQQHSVEQAELEKRGLPFIEFDSGKFDLTQPYLLPLQMIKFLKSFFTARSILSQKKPDIFVSFGGYLAVPLALAAWTLGIPVVTHEQTAAPGFANRCIAHFAKKIAISFPETAKDFPSKKVILTGNPLRQQLWVKNTTKPEWIMKPSQRPLLYVTGGSQGSQTINQTIQEILPQLLQEWDVIHQCGKPNSVMNYKEQLELAKSKLAVSQQAQYVIREEWISEDDLAWIYQHAWGIISRAGANTVQEIIKAAVPTILIPLAHAHHDEQTKNASLLTRNQAALLLTQKELNAESLLNKLNTLKKDHELLRVNLEKMSRQVPLHADEVLYDVIVEAGHEK